MENEVVRNIQSQDSGIRQGDYIDMSEKGQKKERFFKGRKKNVGSDSQSKIEMNESDELDEIMNQEMIKEEINQDSALKMDSNGGNMTTDLETNNERPSVLSTKKTQPSTDQKKSSKTNEKNLKNGKGQLNLGNWVLSASKTELSKSQVSSNAPKQKEKTLVGQKRGKCETRFD